MPIYTYRCSEHGFFDAISTIETRDYAGCPQCGAKCKKVFTVPHVHYRGSGFYTTDSVLYEPIDPRDVDD